MSKKQAPKPVAQKAKSSSAPLLQLSNKIMIPAVMLLFLVLTFLYCKPLLEGMQLSTHDSNQYIALNKESADLKATTGHVTMWSSRMFSGMPAYLMGGLEFSKVIENSPRTTLYKIASAIPDPAFEIMLMLLGAFIGFYVLTAKKSYAFLGAIAIGFCTYNFISLDAGHITKVKAIAMFMPLFAATWLTYQRKYIWGIILFLIFSYEIIAARHVQIAYYGFILIGVYALFEIISQSIRGEMKQAATSSALLAVAITITIMMNFDNYFINDFSKDTTRGGDILNAAKMNPGEPSAPTSHEKGVGFDYATNWSLGFEEIGSLFVPNFAGGSSAAGLDENSAVYKTLSAKGVSPQQASQFVQRMPLYWGSEPFVQGPIYLGAIIVFLFVFACFAYKGKLKGWIIGGVIFTLLISLGKNMEFFYRLLYDFLPGFNKFRAPTMILALTQVLMVIMGVLGLKDFFDNAIYNKENRIKILKLSTGITAGVLIFFIALGSVFSFQSKAIQNGKTTDDQFKEQLVQMTGDQNFANDIYSSLKNDRASAMRSDAMRSLLFVVLVAAVLFVFAFEKFNTPSYIVLAISVLVLADFWTVNKRYLNDDDFEDKSAIEANAFPQTPADAAILAQNKDGARMADFTLDIFNSASPAYYHRTIGGYSPAKLRRYQDIIEHGLSYDFQQINKSGFAHANYINMLNARYIKQAPEASGVFVNHYALGNAWMVNMLETVNSPEEEILKIRTIDPAKVALVNKEFANYIQDVKPNADTIINDMRYVKQIYTKDPMKLEYTFKSPKDEFVVFSEVIYRPNEDWISYIDGKPADHIRVNYILRGMKVKAGEHKITFEFKPKLYAMTNNVLLLGNVLFYVVIAGLVFLYVRKRKSVSNPTA